MVGEGLKFGSTALVPAVSDYVILPAIHMLHSHDKLSMRYFEEIAEVTLGSAVYYDTVIHS